MRTNTIPLSLLLLVSGGMLAAQTNRIANQPPPPPRSPQYEQVQTRLAMGWNTWDVHSVATQVLLPTGLAIHFGLQHNTTLYQDAFLADALIGRLNQGAEQVFPGPHAWDGSYTDLRISWKEHNLRLQTAHDGANLVMLATPLPSSPAPTLTPTAVFSVNYLWNLPGAVEKQPGKIQAREVSVYCTCEPQENPAHPPVAGAYFAADFSRPVGISTGAPLTVEKIQAALQRASERYTESLGHDPGTAKIVDAIQTVIGWDTIYDPENRRVVSPVSRVWSVTWGGYVLFDWDNFFAATLASIGSRDLAYANAIEMLRSATQQGLVPNYARAGDWKSSDRSEPPVGSITVLGLYRKFHDRWFLDDAFPALLRWNRWWAEHRDIQGYLTWGSDGDNAPPDLDDVARGTRSGAILESGLDNSPMYDDAVYNQATHQLEYADVGLMSLYLADCDALATIADTLGKAVEAKEIRQRADRYRARLATLWDPEAGIFLNKDLQTGKFNPRLSPTNFYPLLARAASAEQARQMISKHLLDAKQFWGDYVIPSIARDDPAFNDQNYWRGRIWGPMNYLVYLGLRNYDDSATTGAFAQKSYDLFLKEWNQNGHVHENYNAKTGSGDDVASSDRFYHWGALLGYIEYLQQTETKVIKR